MEAPLFQQPVFNGHASDLSAAYFAKDHKRFREAQVQFKFDSRSEVACAVLMERYIPGFELKTGETFQIFIGGKPGLDDKRRQFRIDFRVGNVFVEYHPIDLSREFKDRSAFREFTDAMRGQNGQDKKDARHALVKELELQYWMRRRLILDLCGYSHCKLITAHSAADFYRRVLKRLGKCPLKEHDAEREFFKIAGAL